MSRSGFTFHCVHLLYCKCHKINFWWNGSYIDSSDWIKNKKAKINHVNKRDNKCFQYPVTVALNHEENKKDPEKITKIKPFTDKYDWEGIHLIRKNNWKKFEKNNLTIAPNVLYAKKEKIYFICVSKNNSKFEKQVIL